MKKGLLLGAVFIAASLAACKKDYACKCGSTVVPATTVNETKKDAKDRCSKLSTSAYTCAPEKQ